MAGPVTGLRPAAAGFTLQLADGQVSQARSVLITTGVSYRRLEAPGLASLLGTGVFYGATGSESSAFADEHVFVVGGANSAGQAAVNLARYARQVTIVVRGESLAARMSQYTQTGSTETVPAAARVVLIGAMPRTGWLPPGISRDEHGFILTGRDLARDGDFAARWTLPRQPLPLETSMPGIFAAGDVRHTARSNALPPL